MRSPARAGGHCYLNNAALAAERLRSRGAARVAVLDIDSHHGNGTQGIFWTARGRSSRCTATLITIIPGTPGMREERGGGAGHGMHR